jgi:hypothetical protein
MLLSERGEKTDALFNKVLLMEEASKQHLEMAK